MEFKPGFRLSVMDMGIILAGIALSVYLYRFVFVWGCIVIFVVGHFFLFCNVFRISRVPELIWAGSFCLLAGLTLLIGVPGWPAVFAAAVMLSTGLILRETRQASYHGVFWRRLNPDLQKWWQNRQGA